MLLLQLPNLIFPVSTFLGPCDLFLLFCNNRIGITQEGFDLFFVSIRDCSLHASILFVFGVEMEDHLSQLGDLLGHLVMCFFVNLHGIYGL